MGKETLDILEFEDKNTKAGKKYTRFKTNEGWLSCFDPKSIEKIKAKVGNKAVLEVIDVNGFKNIKKYVEEEAAETKKTTILNEFPISMKVSYAKDLFINEVNKRNITEKEAEIELMKICCELIKTAEEGFKVREDEGFMDY